MLKASEKTRSSKTSIQTISGNEIMVDGLVPNSSYRLRFKGYNTAGSTPFADEFFEIKTTEPWAPEPINVFKAATLCISDRCWFGWSAPQDNGAPICNYTVFVSQPDAVGDNAFVRCL